MVPDFKPAQQQRALQFANEVRIANAKVLQAIRALPTTDGIRLVADILEDQPEHTGRLEIHALLRAVRQWGAANVNGLLRHHCIHEMRRVQSLTERQRTALIRDMLATRRLDRRQEAA